MFDGCWGIGKKDGIIKALTALGILHLACWLNKKDVILSLVKKNVNIAVIDLQGNIPAFYRIGKIPMQVDLFKKLVPPLASTGMEAAYSAVGTTYT